MMRYTCTCGSPLGPLLLTADDQGLTGLWFADQPHIPPLPEDAITAPELPIFVQTRQWLAQYFSGQEPAWAIPIHLVGTPFQLGVWAILRTIPYGQSRSYGQIAQQLCAELGLPRMSAQAVGGAVARNPVSILVPCHRVLGAGGRLTGYAGGLERKRSLLELEGCLFTN